MKILLGIVIILAIVLAYVYVGGDHAEETTPAALVPRPAVPVWEQPVPEGAELVEGQTAKINVIAERRNNGQQAVLMFHISEEHGYMVDGIRLLFRYRFQDEETGEWIDDDRKVDYFVKDRLEANETLVMSTVLLTLEFQHLGVDLSATTTENWAVEVLSYARAMRMTE